MLVSDASEQLVHRFDDGDAYERFMGSWSRAVGAVFLPWLSATAGACWLDVGCGTGVFTQMILDTSAPAEVFAVDPEPAQIDHARRQPSLARTNFQLADACALPFGEARFDIVTSALVMNFIRDRRQAVSEMGRVVRRGGVIGCYVWDFAADASPSWPLRRALHESGIQIPEIPGARSSSLDELRMLFEQGGLEEIATRSIEISVRYPHFEAFWHAQTPAYSPVTKIISSLGPSEGARLEDAVRALLPTDRRSEIQYWARANAIKANAPQEANMKR